MNQMLPAPSRQEDAPFGATITLAEAMDRLKEDDSLPAIRRRDWLSALRTLARILDRDPSELSASPSSLRRALKRFHPAQAGLSAKRFANVKSDVMSALCHLGVADVRPNLRANLTAEWLALRNRLPGELRWKLSRLSSYASALHIPPVAIDDQVIHDLHAALEQGSLVEDPTQVARATVWAWNRAKREVYGWPNRELTALRTGRSGWTLPLSSFPASFQQDLEAWLSLLRGDDLFSADGPIRPLRPETLKHRQFQVCMLASALVHSGVAQDRITALAVLLEPAHFKAGLRYMLERQDGKPTEALHGLATAMKSLARHYVKLPPRQLEEIGRLCARLKCRHRGLTQKNRARLGQFDDEDNLARLLLFPQRQLDKARKIKNPDRKTALAVQVAVAVEILLMTSMRIENLANLNIDEHLRWTRIGRKGVLHIAIPGAAVKNGVALDRELPPESADLIKTYVETYRPLLCSSPGAWLFPGRSGGPKVKSFLSTQIKRTLLAETGLTVNAHLFRHIGAKLHLDEHPGAYEVVRLVNGHTSVDTTIDNYVGLESTAAARHFDSVILDKRKALKGRGGKR